MRIGIDSYSYHRLLGEIRPGERDPGTRFATTKDLISEMVDAGAEVLSLETVFLAPPDRIDAPVMRRALGDRELALAWGHPLGLEWGTRPDLLSSLIAWIRIAPVLGARVVRCVAAGPALAAAPKKPRLKSTVTALRTAVFEAQRADVVLAIENHADVDLAELSAILEAVPGLAVCLDTANAVRVGDDPVTVTRSVATHVAMVHLKDVAAPGLEDGPTGPASVPYGEGIVDLAGVMDALPLSGLPVCVELGHLGGGDVSERELVRDGVAWLRHFRGQ
jgi:sugar phosphate isomerase/epimerase